MITADDVLMQPGPKRDRYGRYLLPHPETGKEMPWTRATTFAGSIEDNYGLSLWSQRGVLKGASLRPDLVSLAATLDVTNDKTRLDKLTEQAREAAGQGAAANTGTAIHAFTERVDRGGSLDDVPELHRADVKAYLQEMRDADLETELHLIERITAVPSLGVAGTFDRVVRTLDGAYQVADLKTGKDLSRGWLKIAIQLALYAHGVNEAGLWDPGRGEWQGPRSYGDSLETGPWHTPEVSTEVGIVMHLPVGQATCTLYQVDLEAGWAAAQLCRDVRQWRSRKGLAVKLTEPALVRPVGPTWEDLFGAASSRTELAALFEEAAAASLGESRIKALTLIGRQRLGSLGG